jgi:hypothetical protein
MTIFPECDKACSDPSRLFFGGKKLLLEFYDQTIDIPGLIQSMCEFLIVEDPKHAAKKMRSFCSSTGVLPINGLPAIDLMQSGGNMTNPVNNITTLVTESPPAGQTILVRYNFNNNVSASEDAGPRGLIRNFDFEELEERCQLYDEFVNNRRELNHNERWGLATNLLCIRGGETKFLEALLLRIDYPKKKWRGTLTYIKKKGYLPEQCNNYCPYAAVCEHSKNLISTTKLPRGMIKVIKEPELRPLKEVEQELREIWEQSLQDTDGNKVHVIKAPTGIGKTELYLPLKGAVIAVPTHRLQHEVASRMDVIGNHDYLISPELPKLSGEDKGKIDHFYHLADTGDEKAQEYVDKLDEINWNLDRKTIITTHAKFLYLETPCDQVIIDEDILSTLISQKMVYLHHLRRIAEKLSGNNLKIMNSFIDYFEKAQEELVFPIPPAAGDGDRIKKIAINTPDITTNVLGLFGATHFIKSSINGEIVIHYVNRRELPANKSYIILSATVSEEIYKLLFGDRLVFHDLGYAEMQGKIIQYADRSYSREGLRNQPELIEQAKAIIGDNVNVITFLEYAKEFPNTVTHFGGLAGIDELGGKDLAIVGTPNINPFSYLLTAAALGVKLGGFEDYKLRYRKVNNENYEFYFQTFTNNKILQDIQFSCVQSELLQAIGRARPIRHDVTITLFSNYPVPGAEYRTYRASKAQ